MTKEDFVRSFKVEKDRMLDSYLADSSELAVSAHIRSLGLSVEQSVTIRKLLDDALTDVFFTILYGLDGCVSIGDMKQQNFQIRSEDGSIVCCGNGEVEGLTSKYFTNEAA